MLNKHSINTIKHLGHLGLVAGTAQKIQLAQQIDQILPLHKEKGVNLSHGKRVEGMICTALSFLNTRMYLFAEYLQNKPVEQLLGDGCKAEYFTDDACGRTLDAIAAYGCNKFFTTLAFAIAKKFQLFGKTFRTDTTSLTVYGEYPEEREQNFENARPKHGYSKDGKPQFKQMIMHLATTGAANFPIWAESLSGNTSDKKSLPSIAKRMGQFCKEMDLPEDFIYVGDSAFYSGAVKLGKELKWLSRVPQTIKKCIEITENNTNEIQWEKLENGYKIAPFHVHHKNFDQRWLLVSSEKAYKREIHTLEKKIAKEQEAYKKQIKNLKTTPFNCIKDSEKAVKKLRKPQYHTLEYTIESIMGFTDAGRPKSGAQPTIQGYQLHIELQQNQKAIQQEKNKKGRFILATNQLDKTKLSNKEMLSEYKKQSGIEQGFAFLKDKNFEVSSIYLKKPSRIAALMSLMGLSLMVFGLCQHFIRAELKKRNETLPNQVKKQVQNPTANWIFFLFMGVTTFKIKEGDVEQEFVANLNPLLERIIAYLGKETEKIYGLVG